MTLKLLIVLQVFIDLLLLGIVAVNFFRIGTIKGANFSSADEERLLNLKESINTLLKEADDVAEKISGKIENEQEKCSELVKKLEQKRSEMSVVLALINETLEKAKDAGLSTQIEETYEPNDYDRVLELKKQGLSRDEIVEKLNIPEGEVDLILGLMK